MRFRRRRLGAVERAGGAVSRQKPGDASGQGQAGMMQQGWGRRAWLWTAALAIAACTCGHGTASAQGRSITSASGGGFMMLANAGSEPDRLSGGSTEVAAALEIHEIHIVNGVAMRRQLNPGVSIKPGASAAVARCSAALVSLPPPHYTLRRNRHRSFEGTPCPRLPAPDRLMPQLT